MITTPFRFSGSEEALTSQPKFPLKPASLNDQYLDQSLLMCLRFHQAITYLRTRSMPLQKATGTTQHHRKPRRADPKQETCLKAGGLPSTKTNGGDLQTVLPCSAISKALTAALLLRTPKGKLSGKGRRPLPPFDTLGTLGWGWGKHKQTLAKQDCLRQNDAAQGFLGTNSIWNMRYTPS